MEKKEISINPKAPDEHWVSPSGSDTWCTVGQLKALLTENKELKAKVNSFLERSGGYDCTEPNVCAALLDAQKEVERLRTTPEAAGEVCP